MIRNCSGVGRRKKSSRHKWLLLSALNGHFVIFTLQIFCFCRHMWRCGDQLPTSVDVILRSFCVICNYQHFIFDIKTRNGSIWQYNISTNYQFVTVCLCIYGQSPRLQESCDPSSVLVCSDIHFRLTSFITEFMHRPFRKCIVIHSLDKKKCAFDHCNALKMSFLACR